MAKRRVLITGASGEITRQLLPTFRDHYELVLLDTRPSAHANDIIEVDVSDPDIDTYREHFRGVDAIVHNVRSTMPGVTTRAPSIPVPHPTRDPPLPKRHRPSTPHRRAQPCLRFPPLSRV